MLRITPPDTPVNPSTLFPVRWRLVCALALCALSAPCGANEAEPGEPSVKRPLPAVSTPAGVKPPVVDGDLSDPVWQRAARAIIFYDPRTGKPVPEQTEAYMTYDREHIYVAFHCHDSQPDTIVARESVPNAELDNDDHVRIDIDPFLTYKFNDFTSFSVNARGTKNCRLGGGRASKVEWQGDWKAAARRVSDGWTAEMAIPWGILSYPRVAGPLTMGINFRRRQQRTQITSFWSDIGPQFFSERQGLWRGVEAPVQAWRPRFSLLPYFMPSGYSGGGTSQVRVGLDGRYQPTPELTGVFTLNPDFASVEGAVEGVFFSRSERFVPDRRPFFLEGQDYLRLGQGYQLGLLFNSNRIERADAGLKVYGKLNPRTTMGMLGTIAPGSQANMVAQMRHELGATSNVQFMAMQRLAPGEDNTVLAGSSEYRKGKWSVDGQLVHTLGPGAGGLGWTTAVNLSDNNLFTTIRYRNVPGNFTNRLGFIPFSDYHGFSSYTNWNVEWRKGFWRNFNLDFFPTWDWHLDGRPFRRNAGFFLAFETRSDYRIGLNGEAGKFNNDTDATIGISLGGGVTNRFRQWGLDFTTGQLANRPFTSFGPSFKVRLFRKLDVLLSSYVQNLDGVTQQHILTFNYELSPYRSWGGRIVIEDGNINPYLSYRASGRTGTDVYFILGDPNARRFVQRFMMKLVFAL